MKIKLLMLAILTLLTQSCCVYHSSEKIGDKKISEMGIAPYNSRPIKQMYEDEVLIR